jgi:hypothetical protein
MEHIFLTHDPQWRNVDDIKLTLSIFKNKNIWYRSGKWGSKIIQNISCALDGNNKYLSLSSEGNPHNDLFKNKHRKISLIIVFTSWSPGPEDRPSWCSGVISNSIKCGIPMITRNPIEKGWVLSWGSSSDRHEKIFSNINELSEFTEYLDEFNDFANKVDWINDELNLNLFDDNENDYITIIKDLTEDAFTRKLSLAKERVREIKEQEEREKKENCIKFYDPVMSKLRQKKWKKNKDEANDKIIKEEVDTELKQKPLRTRRMGKRLIKY